MEFAWAIRRDPAPFDAGLAGMVDSLGSIFDLRGLWQLGDRWNERAIALRRESEIAKDPIALSHALYRRAGLLRNRGHYEEAKQLYHESLQLNQLAANLQGQAASLHQHATMELAQGNPAEARQLLLRSLGIAETIDDQHGQAASLHQLAIIELAQGNPSEARRLLEQSLSMKEHIGD